MNFTRAFVSTGKLVLRIQFEFAVGDPKEVQGCKLDDYVGGFYRSATSIKSKQRLSSKL